MLQIEGYSNWAGHDWLEPVIAFAPTTTIRGCNNNDLSPFGIGKNCDQGWLRVVASFRELLHATAPQGRAGPEPQRIFSFLRNPATPCNASNKSCLPYHSTPVNRVIVEPLAPIPVHSKSTGIIGTEPRGP